MASLSFFVNGKKQGIEKRWSINGQLTKEINYLDDKKHGDIKIWYGVTVKKSSI